MLLFTALQHTGAALTVGSGGLPPRLPGGRGLRASSFSVAASREDLPLLGRLLAAVGPWLLFFIGPSRDHC